MLSHQLIPNLEHPCNRCCWSNAFSIAIITQIQSTGIITGHNHYHDIWIFKIIGSLVLGPDLRMVGLYSNWKGLRKGLRPMLTKQKCIMDQRAIRCIPITVLPNRHPRIDTRENTFRSSWHYPFLKKRFYPAKKRFFPGEKTLFFWIKFGTFV